MKKNNCFLRSAGFDKLRIRIFLPVAALAFLVSCGGSGTETTSDADASAQAQIEEAKRAVEEENAAKANSKGIGPVQNVEIGPLDAALAEKGKALFEAKCTACHRLTEQKIVGPGLAGVTKKRTPEWLMNMMINPEEMTKKDPIARELLEEHLTQMTNQNVNEEDARAMLEYLRQNDGVQ